MNAQAAAPLAEAGELEREAEGFEGWRERMVRSSAEWSRTEAAKLARAAEYA